MFVTLIYLIIDATNRVLYYSNAGHPPIMRKGARNETEQMEGPKSLPLGLSKEAVFQMESIHLNKGDLLFLFTDGLIEMKNPKGRYLGLPRLFKFIEKEGGNAEKTVRKTMKWAKSFSKGVPQHDDLTAMAVKIG
jgi:sigma-B regulation protein RsbU (phosphoserine phosphatase)